MTPTVWDTSVACCLLASGLVGANPLNEVLIVTGSPRVHAFSLPERVDTVKLPSATKDDSGCYSPRKLVDGIDALVQVRSELITAATTSYEPDFVDPGQGGPPPGATIYDTRNVIDRDAAQSAGLTLRQPGRPQ